MIMLGKLNRDSQAGLYKVTTESGAEYRVTVADGGHGYMQRIPGPDSSKLRQDTGQLNLLDSVDLEVNKSGTFVLEPLAADAVATFRITTPVTSIEQLN